MKRRLVTLALLILFAGCAVISPLRKSECEIRQSLLRENPIGTHIDQVQHWLTAERRLNVRRLNGGYFTDQGQVVGVTALATQLGEYWEIPVPFGTSVEAFWGFDRAGLLVDLWVRKSTDAP
jgi:hypothetical protein